MFTHQRIKACLYKMYIGCQHLADKVIIHNYKRGTIHQPPGFVIVLTVFVQRAAKQGMGLRNDFDLGFGVQSFNELVRPDSLIPAACKSVERFSKHGFTGDQLRWADAFGDLNRFVMIAVPGID